MALKCWASPLGSCDGRQSAEHYVSKSVWASTKVRVQGFPWCKDEPKEVGLSSLTRKILCRHHNSALSELDAAAGAAMQTLRDASAFKPAYAKPWSVAPEKFVRFALDAGRLERWLLKTAAGFHYGSDFLFGALATVRGEIPLEWVEVCYGQRPIAAGAGLYFAANVGMQAVMKDDFTYRPLYREEDNMLVAGLFEFHGIRMLLSLEGGGKALEKIGNVQGLDKAWADAGLMQSLERIQFAGRAGLLTHCIDVDWSSKLRG